MSKISIGKIKCKCGCKIEFDRYDSVNAMMNSELIDKLIDGSLRKIDCPECKMEYIVEYPILYNTGFLGMPMIQYYPYDDIEEAKQKNDELMEQMNQMFGKTAFFGIQHNKTQFVQNYDEFVEIIKKIRLK